MIIKKIINTYQKEGIRAVIRKSKLRFKNEGVAVIQTPTAKIKLSELPQMPQLEDIIKANYQDLSKKSNPHKINKEKLNITWITPPVGPGGGGHTTITRFAKYLQNKGHKVSFAIYNTNTIDQSPQEAKDIFRKSYGIVAEVKELDSLVDEDVILATSWETAYGLFNLATQAHKFYFVQDFEPMFFGVGSRYVLAEATYKFGFYGITAGKWLTEKMQSFGMAADYFDFGVDLEVYKPKNIQGFIKKKKIAFYARAHTERRGFEIGVFALQIFSEKHPEYEIVFFGQNMTNYDIPFEYTDLGILTKEELAELYHESVACLVLSLTNVSLLPLELLAAGCIPVMNSGDNNTMVLGDLDGIEYTDAYPTSLANRLSQVVEKSSQEISDTAQTISEEVTGRTWESSYKKVEKIILREVAINE